MALGCRYILEGDSFVSCMLVTGMVLTWIAVTPLYCSSGEEITRLATWSNSSMLKLLLLDSFIMALGALVGSSRIMPEASYRTFLEAIYGSVFFLFLILTLMMLAELDAFIFNSNFWF